LRLVLLFKGVIECVVVGLDAVLRLVLPPQVARQRRLVDTVALQDRARVFGVLDRASEVGLEDGVFLPLTRLEGEARAPVAPGAGLAVGVEDRLRRSVAFRRAVVRGTAPGARRQEER